MAEEQQAPDPRVIRRQRKAAITRHLGAMERYIAEDDVNEVIARLHSIKVSFDDFERAHDVYHGSLESDDEMIESELWFSEVETRYTQGVGAARSWVNTKTRQEDNERRNTPSPTFESIGESNHSSISAHNSELINLLSIPKLEIDKFDGNPMDYKTFIAIFNETVASKVTDDNIKLTRLLQYTCGPAKDAIRNCSMLGGSKGYTQALDILSSRFGNDHLISRKIINDLKIGKVVNRAEEIQQLADELATAQGVLNSMKMMSEIDNQQTMLSILQRCPSYIRSKWRGKALDHKREFNEYPNFQKFVQFIQLSASECNDPVYGNEATKSFRSDKSRSATCFSAASGGRRDKVDDNRNERGQPRGFKNNQARGQVNMRFSNQNQSHSYDCPLCKEGHRLVHCDKFKVMTCSERFDIVKSNKLCFNCLRPKHGVGQCRDPTTCSVCGRKHSKFIHFDRSQGGDDRRPKVSEKDRSNNDVDNNATVASTSAFGSTVYLPIVTVVVNGEHALGLLDTGSTNSFITKSLASRLDLRGKPHSFVMNTVSDSRGTDSINVSVTLSNCEGSFVQKVDDMLVVPDIPAKYPSIDIDVRKHPHLRDIPINKINAGSKVDILIGMDNSNLLMPLEVRHSNGPRPEPYATRSVFGWALNGPVGKGGTSHNICSNFVQLDTKVDSCWTNDEGGFDEVGFSVEDKKVLSLWDTEVKRDEGHYELPIPWKGDRPNFPNNKYVAECRLISLSKRLEKTGLFTRYDENIAKMLDKGYVERVPDQELCLNDGSVWYIPHHPVISQSRPDKVRPVFDCAAKFQGVSLNSECFQGPNLTNNLIDVLLRFRQYKFAITADIESMYLQVRIPDRDRNALRFLWYGGNNVVQYRSASHLFGGKWSGSASSYALRRTVADHSCSELVSDTVLRSFYVDDLLKSVPSLLEGKEVIEGTKQVLKKGGFNLTKFTANDYRLLEAVDPADRAQDVRELLPETVSKALGIKWEVGTDLFTYVCKHLSLSDVVTRRLMLSHVSSFYDPLGLIAPVVLPGKILFQDATRLKLGWDDEVPHNLSDRWRSWKDSLTTLESIKFERCVLPEEFMNGVCEVHHFCDASMSGYGACCYLRVGNSEGKIHVRLLASKCRLAPLNQSTIPRLELCAAVLATGLDQLIRSKMDIRIVKSWFWTDSRIVLSYIRNESKRFKVFVANRVSKIRQLSEPDQWHHIPGEDNPADVLSRGCSVDNLPDIWFRGAHFLHKHKSDWPVNDGNDIDISMQDPEVIKEKEAHVLEVTSGTFLQHPLNLLIDHYSSFYRLCKAVSWLLRFKMFLKEKTLIKGFVRRDEMVIAERHVVSFVQEGSFPVEIQQLKNNESVKLSSPLSKLTPMMLDGMMVVGGRLKHSPIPQRSKFPVILPRDHKVSFLIAQEEHNYAHLGVEWVLSRIRSRFWIIRARSLVKNIKHACITCKRLYAPAMSQKMSDLPDDRCKPNVPAFSCAGVDVFGPFYVKQGRASVKRYGCVFSCFSSRALHIEKLDDLSTSA